MVSFISDLRPIPFFCIIPQNHSGGNFVSFPARQMVDKNWDSAKIKYQDFSAQLCLHSTGGLFMLIVLINAVTVVIGGVIGSFLKRGISAALKQAILFSIGLYVVYLGITGLSSEIRSVVLLLSVVLGTLCGTALHLDDAMNRGAQRLQTALLRNREDARFAEGLCTFFIVSCTGAYVIIACFNAGMGQGGMLYTKVAMDLIVSMMMASTLGVGVAFAALPLAVYEGLLVLCAGWITPILTDEMLQMFSCAGALITIPIGTNMMGITKVRIADLIPVLVFAPVLAWIAEAVLH